MTDSLANTQGRVREWIGPRIIPVFADEVQWSDESNYEPLMMVQNQGETFMSRQYVPAGAPLPNVENGQESTDYWVHMSNWNAQVEAYREEVMEYAQTVLGFSSDISDLQDALPIAEFDSVNTVKAAIDAINTAITAITANDWVTTARIADSNVTTGKINDAAITTNKIADDAVTTNKIADGAITSDKIASNAITSSAMPNEYAIAIGNSWIAPSNQSDPGYGDEVVAFMNSYYGYPLKVYGRGSAGWMTAGQQTGETIAAAIDEAIEDNENETRVCTHIFLLEMQNDQSYFSAGTIPQGYVQIINNNVAKLQTAFPNAKFHYIIDNSKSTTTQQMNTFYKMIARNFMFDFFCMFPLIPEEGWRNDAHLANNFAGNGKLARCMYACISGGSFVFPDISVTSTNPGNETDSATVVVRGDIVKNTGTMFLDVKLKRLTSVEPAGYAIDVHFENSSSHVNIELLLGVCGHAYAKAVNFTSYLDSDPDFLNLASGGNIRINFPPGFKTWLYNNSSGTVRLISTMITQGSQYMY